jgi:hypothetical protein
MAAKWKASGTAMTACATTAKATSQPAARLDPRLRRGDESGIAAPIMA